MNGDFAWGMLVATLHGNFKVLDPVQASAHASEAALWLAQQAGQVSNKPRIHLAAEAK